MKKKQRQGQTWRQRQSKTQEGCKSHLPCRGELNSSPAAFPPTSLTNPSIMQLHFNKQEAYKGHFQTPRMPYVKESNTALRGQACALSCPRLAGFQNFLIENTFGFWSWMCGGGTDSCGLSSLPCRSVEAGLFILGSRRSHSIQRNTCCPHCQLPFPSCRQEVKNWKSLKLLARAFVISRFIHCFQQAHETKCTNCQECSGTAGVCFLCWRAVLKYIKSEAANSDTALGIELDLQRDCGGGGTMFLGLIYNW